MKKGKLLVISGPSGVGKGTVVNELMKLRNDMCFSVSATTRSPRPGEVDGVSYFFVSKERFEEMRQQCWWSPKSLPGGQTKPATHRTRNPAAPPIPAADKPR